MLGIGTLQIMGESDMANTPLRSFRISDEVYNAAKDQAELDGVSVTEVVVQMLKTYGGK